MATYHIDLVNGLDTNNGTSWATAWKTFANGATAARTAPGDLIKVAKTADPINTGLTFKVGSQNTAASRTPSSSSVTITSNGVGVPLKATITAHGMETGDVVWGFSGVSAAQKFAYPTTITKIDANNFTMDAHMGSSASGTTYTANTIINGVNKCFVVTNPSWKCLIPYEQTWTAVTGTAALATSAPVPKVSNSLTRYTFPATTAVSTLYAYKNLPATTDLSDYTALSFILSSASAVSANTVKVVLCGDLNGATPLAEAYLPAGGVAWFNGQIPVGMVLDFGAALPNAVKSIAIYSGTSAPVVNSAIIIDDICAVKSASDPTVITHQSLVGSNDGTGRWYPVRALGPTGVIMVEVGSTSSSGSDSRCYHGEDTGTYNLWTLPSFKSTGINTSTSAVYTINEGGGLTTPIVYQGGWDPSTNTKNGQTVLESWANDTGIMFSGSSLSNVTFDNFSGFKYWSTLSGFTDKITMNFNTASCFSNFTAPTGKQALMNIKSVLGCDAFSFTGQNSCGTYNIDYLVATRTTSLNGLNNTFTIKNVIGTAGGAGLAYGSQASSTFLYCTTMKRNGINSPYSSTLDLATNVSTNYIDLAAVPVTAATLADNTTWSSASLSDARFITSRIGCSDETIKSLMVTDGATAWLRTGFGEDGGLGWRMKILTNTRMPNYPFSFPIGAVACAANQAVTINVRVQNLTTNHTAKLVMPGGVIAGVVNSVESTATVATTWQTLSVTFTPTEDGVVEPYISMWLNTGSTATLYFDNVTVV